MTRSVPQFHPQGDIPAPRDGQDETVCCKARHSHYSVDIKIIPICPFILSWIEVKQPELEPASTWNGCIHRQWSKPVDGPSHLSFSVTCLSNKHMKS